MLSNLLRLNTNQVSILTVSWFWNSKLITADICWLKITYVIYLTVCPYHVSIWKSYLSNLFLSDLHLSAFSFASVPMGSLIFISYCFTNKLHWPSRIFVENFHCLNLLHKWTTVELLQCSMESFSCLFAVSNRAHSLNFPL